MNPIKALQEQRKRQRDYWRGQFERYATLMNNFADAGEKGLATNAGQSAVACARIVFELTEALEGKGTHVPPNQTTSPALVA